MTRHPDLLRDSERGGHRRGVRPAALLTSMVVVTAALSPLTSSPAGAQQVDASVGATLTVSAFTGLLGPGTLPDEDLPDADPPDEEADDADDEGDQDPPAGAGYDLEVRVLVENHGEVPLDDLRLVVEIYPAATTRAGLHAALEGDLPAFPDIARDTPVRDNGAVQPGDLAGASLTVPGEELAWPTDTGVVRPVRIAVVRGVTPLDELVTAAVWLPERPQDPVSMTFVWPFDGAPWRTVGGAYPAGADLEIRQGARLEVLLRTLERVEEPPVVLAPAAHLLEDLAHRTGGFTVFERQDDGTLESRSVSAEARAARRSDEVLQRVRALASELPDSPVSGTYADADLASLLEADDALLELAAEAAVDGRRRLQRQLGREIDATTHLLYAPPGTAALDLLPGENLLLPYASTTGVPLEEGPAPAWPLRSITTPSGRLLTVVVADPYLEHALGAGELRDDPVVATQRVLAEAAMAYLDPPPEGRALLMLPPRDWAPSPAYAARLLDALAEATWLEPTSTSGLSSLQSAPGLELADPIHPPFPDGVARALVEATSGLAAANAAMPEGVTNLGDRQLSELRDSLLRASSSWLRSGAEGEADRLARDVQRAVDTVLGDVEVVAGSVTLTSDEGQVPITVQRTRGGPITVAVEVTSQGRLLWPLGRRSDPFVLEAGETQTVSFSTQALSTGTFPVTVLVTDPSGERLLGSASMTVRSTAISGPALTVIGLVILVLLLLGAVRGGGLGARGDEAERETDRETDETSDRPQKRSTLAHEA